MRTVSPPMRPSWTAHSSGSKATGVGRKTIGKNQLSSYFITSHIYQRYQTIAIFEVASRQQSSFSNWSIFNNSKNFYFR